MKRLGYLLVLMLISACWGQMPLLPTIEVVGEYVSHDQIQIIGDSEFAQYAINESWQGKGTRNDPYVISGYEIIGDGHGIHIISTSVHFILSDMRIRFKEIPGGYNLSHQSGIYLDNVENGRIYNCTIENNKYGIYMDSSFSCSIMDNTITNNNHGIYLYDSGINNINGNTISKNKDYGIKLIFASYNDINKNSILANRKAGISIYNSDNNEMLGNIISYNEYYGIETLFSEGNEVIDNHIQSNSPDGIYLYDSTETNISNNSFINNGIRFSAGPMEEAITNSIDTLNTINNKPFYYSINQTGGTVPPNVGQIILINCRDMRIENQVITNVSVGISFISCSNITIINNIIDSNSLYGISFRASSDNIISNNTISNNDDEGIIFSGSHNNTITYNLIKSNDNCINLHRSINNTFHHNNFVDNRWIHLWTSELNIWSDGNGEGNYWSDYDGIDWDGDGVGDTKLPHQYVDNHPLMNPADSGIKDSFPLIYLIFFMALLVLVILSFIIIVQFKRKKKRAKIQNKDRIGENSSKSRKID
jgi:parallel beta-helix repeat protein